VNVSITIMSGVDDGQVMELDAATHGTQTDESWVLSIGRRDESDIVLRNDSFVSRAHASLRHSHGRWWLTDHDSKNGSFLESAEDDLPIRGTVALEAGQLFRIGRTWLRLHDEG
jgi:pSer/pThr/pTyr-binding forkhead associated (FHA) protein